MRMQSSSAGHWEKRWRTLKEISGAGERCNVAEKNIHFVIDNLWLLAYTNLRKKRK